MLNWAVTFFVVALIAALLGFGGVAGHVCRHRLAAGRARRRRPRDRPAGRALVAEDAARYPRVSRSGIRGHSPWSRTALLAFTERRLRRS